MFFWKRLYSGDYEQALWRTALKRVFPNKSLKRATIATQLERIYQTRNRIAHHEPIYGRRLTDTLTAIDFVVKNFGNPGAGGLTPIGKLLENDLLAVKQEAAALEAKLIEFRTGSLPP